MDGYDGGRPDYFRNILLWQRSEFTKESALRHLLTVSINIWSLFVRFRCHFLFREPTCESEVSANACRNLARRNPNRLFFSWFTDIEIDIQRSVIPSYNVIISTVTYASNTGQSATFCQAGTVKSQLR